MSDRTPAEGRTRNELEEEVRSLREQLSEAEAVLDAIRFDRVDALVVSHPDEGEHVRTIESIGVIANSIFDQVVQPVFVLNEDNLVLRANPAAVRLCGPDVEGRALREALPLEALGEHGPDPEAGQEVLPPAWVREGKELLRREVAYVDPEGESRYFLMEAKVFYLRRENFTGGIVTLVDITTEKRSEIELAVRNEQLRYQFELTTAITENAAEALLLLDENGRVIFLNPAAVRLVGVGEDALIGRHLEERVRIEEDGERSDFSGDPIELVGITRVQRNFQATLDRWDGVRIPVQGSASPVKGEGGRLTGSVLVLRDVSDLQEAERALRASEEERMQSQKMEAVGLLAGGIAHDFNNLLTAINGYADLLDATLEEGAPGKEFAHEIRRAGARAAGLTSQLLAFGRRQMHAAQVMSLNETIEDLERMLRRVIGETIEISLDLDPSLGAILADPVQVEQVLLNLAINARDAMPKGGTLELKTANVAWSGEDPHSPLHGMTPGPWVELRVRDHGVGIDAEIQERIFEPFFSTKGQTRSGLGLSTVYGIMQQSGGRIALSSAPGTGTEFRLYFPRVEREPAGSERPGVEKAAPARGTGTILVVEDEDIVRGLIEKILVSLGYDVLTASSGEEALDTVATGDAPIDLVLTDVVMPGMGGRELARRLAEMRPEVPVAFMSGYTDDEVFQDPALQSRSDFIGKPFAAAELADFVREALGRGETGVREAAPGETDAGETAEKRAER